MWKIKEKKNETNPEGDEVTHSHHSHLQERTKDQNLPL